MARFVKVAKASDVPVGGALCVNVQGQKIALFNLAGEIYAIDDTCSHAEASLSEGTVDGECVACPRHGALFNIKTGQAQTLPAWAPVETYEVKLDGDDVLISV